MKPRRAVLSLGLGLLALASAPPNASADPISRGLLRSLYRPGERHPLADGTGRIPLLVTLPQRSTAESLGLLDVAPGVGAIRLAPEDALAFASLHPEVSLHIQPPVKRLLDKSSGWNRLPAYRPQAAALKSGAGTGSLSFVGIVDSGIDITHPDFRDSAGKTRIAWLLVGGQAAAGLQPELEQKFGCSDPNQTSCAIYAAADIDALIAKGGGGVGDTEGHGTHVASIAAGNGGLMPATTSPYAGVAPDAKLLVAAGGDAKGFAAGDILRGAKFVFDRADAMHGPVAVNVSLGTDFGAHDGTNPLETGLAAFVGDAFPGHVVVVAAGNSGGLLQMSDGTLRSIHTDVTVSPDETVRVPFTSPAASDSAGSQIIVWIAWRSGSNTSVALEGPDHSTWIGFTGAGEQNSYNDTTHKNVAGIANAADSPDLGLTATQNSAVVLLQGNWQDKTEFAVQLRGQGYADLWISYVGLADPGALFATGDADGSIAIPASAPSLLSVGCTVNRLSWPDYHGKNVDYPTLVGDPTLTVDTACGFSARGPTRTGLFKPEISAPGGFVVGAMSAGADPRTSGAGGLFDGCPVAGNCLVVDSHHAVAEGTSMSTPQVTGAIALLLEIDPSITEARAIALLQGGARKPALDVGDPDQLGAGALDIKGALDTLEGITGGAVSPSQSWFTLSNPFLLPDMSLPVTGVVELRDAAGAIASADASQLRVLAEGAEVVQPPERVAGSTFRFAVAAPPAAVDTQVTLDVTYAGHSVGTRRSVPVAQDPWRGLTPTFDGTSEACSLSDAPGRPWPGGAALLVFGIVGAIAARRRRGAGGLRT